MWLLAALLIADSTITLTVTLPNEEYVSVTIAGEGQPVVLLPGLFGSAYGYRRLTPLLTRAGYRALIVEPLGIGASARPRHADYSLTAQADRVAAALDTLGIDHAIVVGHGLSASIALRIALRRPGLVAGVVLLDGGLAEAAASPGLRRAMVFAPLIRIFGGKGIIRNKIYRQMIAASADTSWVTPDVVEGYTQDAARDLGKTLDALKGMVEAKEPQLLTPRLGEIACPVRLVAGSAEHEYALPPNEIVDMREGLPSFVIDSVPGVGYFAFEEQPAAVVGSVRRVGAARLLAALPHVP
jgi:pimeloyl-ACP methyl ester carboxylesterase